jgi:transketolase
MKLEKLIVFYDDNGISIDGHTAGWFNDDTPKRFEAYGWRVIRDVDGLDNEAVAAAAAEAVTPCGRPTLVCCKTIIGYGAPKLGGTQEAHGAALGAAEVAASRAALGWTYPPFEVPAEIRTAWDARAAGEKRQAAWEEQFAAYAKAFPAEAAEFRRRVSGALPEDFAAKADAAVAEAAALTDAIATRKASQNAITAFAPFMPEFFGGSADLTGSNLTNWKGCITIEHGKAGNYLHYGVREFGMAAMLSGIALHGGFVPFGGTFLVFADYARNAIRLAALMGIRSIYVLTHDSIGLGEDGPTHQPIEHAAYLRLIPGLDVWRPCDMLETAVAWRCAIERADGPSALLLSRQNCPQHGGGMQRAALVTRGGYVLSDTDGTPDVVLIATGSEMAITTGARDLLAERGVKARVVSMPCADVFDKQDKAWRDAVLPPGIRRVAVEAGATMSWYKYVGLEGAVVGIDRFGESAPGGAVMKYLGFTAEHVAEVAGKA